MDRFPTIGKLIINKGEIQYCFAQGHRQMRLIIIHGANPTSVISILFNMKGIEIGLFIMIDTTVDANSWSKPLFTSMLMIIIAT